MDAEQSLIGSVLFRATASQFDSAAGLWNLWRPKLTGVPQEDVAAGEQYAHELVEAMRVLNMPHLMYQAMVDCHAAHAAAATVRQTDWFMCGFCCKIAEIALARGASLSE